MDDVALYNRAITATELAQTSGNINTAAGNWVNTGFVAPANTWTHLAVTYDNGLVKTYANGVLVSTVTGSGAIGDTDTARNNLTIGGVADSNRSFQGRISGVKVYNNVLDVSTLLGKYQAQGLQNSLIAYLPGNGSVADARRDASDEARYGGAGDGRRPLERRAGGAAEYAASPLEQAHADARLFIARRLFDGGGGLLHRL